MSHHIYSPKNGLCFSLIILIVVLSVGCEASFSTAKLSDATMCTKINEETKEPVEKTDVFTSDSPEIYCSVKLSNAPSDTKIKSEWIYVKGEAEDLSDYVIDEFTITTEGTKYVSFSLSRPNTGFPKGEYILKLYLDDEIKLSVPFKVV
ncbi:hypothetical protein ACFLRW_03440 [Acidobacteriota bacterium]